MNTLLLLLAAGAGFWYFTRTPSATTPAATTPVYVPPGGGTVTPVPPGSVVPVPATSPPTPAAPLDAGQLVSVSAPDAVYAGAAFALTVTVRNVGNTWWGAPDGAWTDLAGDGVKPTPYLAFAQHAEGVPAGSWLSITDPRRVGGGFPAWLPAPLNPGESVTVQLSVRAPEMPGTYAFAVDVWNQHTMQEIAPVTLVQVTVAGDANRMAP